MLATCIKVKMEIANCEEAETPNCIGATLTHLAAKVKFQFGLSHLL